MSETILNLLLYLGPLRLQAEALKASFEHDT
jgi:hypothetical protein